MPDLSHLKVGQVPAAFAELAAKHNALVQLIASMEAATGLDIKIVSAPPKRLAVPTTPGSQSKIPQGRIRIGLKPLSGVGGAGPGGGGAGTTQAVSIDGTLVNVAAASGVNTNTTNYPTSLHINTNGTTLDMTPSVGYKTTDIVTGSLAQLDPFGLRIYDGSGGKALDIDGTALTHNMSIVTINVCVNGSGMLMDVIASAPY